MSAGARTPPLDSYEWLPTECADERAPMQLISGELVCKDGGEFVPIPTAKLINNGWGEVGSRRLVGEALKPVPERLTAAWFSYMEDQFFAGSLELPQAELAQLFANGFVEPLTNKRVTWSKIIVGMGLGGWTSVWLAGSGLVQEVASAKFEATELDWAQVLDNPAIPRSQFIHSKLRARLSSAELKALAEHGPPAPTLPRRSRAYHWRLLVEGIQVPLHMFLRSFNGDRHFYEFARQPPEQLHRVPKSMQITWLSRGGRKLLTKISLDEAEVFAAFDQIGAAAPGTAAPGTSSATLHVEYGARSRVSIWVEGDGPRVPLTRSSVEVLSLA